MDVPNRSGIRGTSLPVILPLALIGTIALTLIALPSYASDSPSTTNLRSTTTTITPQTAIVGIGGIQVFTATVVDTGPGTPTTPTGNVTWVASPPHGNHFPDGRTCILVPINSSASSCHVSYWSAKGGSRGITGTYHGDLSHARSKGQALLIIVSG